MDLRPALLALLLAAPAAAQDDGALERGRQLTGWLLAGQADSLAAALSPEFLDAVGGRDGLAAFAGQVATAGAEGEVTDERAFPEGGLTAYYRVSRFENVPSVTAQWVWDAGGTVVGMLLTPTPRPAASDHLDYETRAPLRLPFAAPAGGSWYVAWGGRDPVHNYHVVAPDQRFAYDFVVTRDGATHAGDGAANADYFCWDEPVLAPAAGRVVAAADSVADNVPGEMDEAAPVGNHVVIDHGEGEFSFLAHLRRGSVAVAEGDAVEAGAVLGACGNSGRSSEPHLHYHLQTTPTFGAGAGLPAPFHGYTVGGTAVERGEPVRGQSVTPSE